MLPKTETRTPITLRQPTQRKLTSYALSAGAAGVSMLSLAPLAEAQIVYTPARQTVSHNHEILVDLNHDGVTDFAIREIENRFGSGNSLQAVPIRPGGGIESSQIAAGWAADLRHGQQIGPTARFAGATALMANYSSYGNYGSGVWRYAVGKARYLGIRFQINGEAHYGWARLNVKYSYSGKDIGALLTGYAYQTQPNTAILAGATGEGDAIGESSSTPPGQREPMSLGALALGSTGFPIRPSTLNSDH
jgi:hypothetical protein